MKIIIVFIMMIKLAWAAGICIDAAWQVKANDPLTSLDQQCLCHADNITYTSYLLYR